MVILGASDKKLFRRPVCGVGQSSPYVFLPLAPAGNEETGNRICVGGVTRETSCQPQESELRYPGKSTVKVLELMAASIPMLRKNYPRLEISMMLRPPAKRSLFWRIADRARRMLAFITETIVRSLLAEVQ